MAKQEIIVKAEQREGRGKNDSRRTRASGRVPLVIYGGDGGSVSVTAPLAELAAILRSDTSYNTIFTLDIAGVGTSEVMFLDRQIDPIRGRLIHADLRRLVSGEKIEMNLPLHFVGTPIGLKDGGGYLDQAIHEIAVMVDPHKAPEYIEVDVSELGIGDSLHVSDVKMPDGLEAIEAADTLVAQVGVLRQEAEEPVAEVAEGTEPEVIAKGKKEEE